MEQDAGEYGHPCGSRIQQHHRHGGSAQLDGDLQRTEKHADAQHTEKAEEQRVLHRDARPAADARLGKKQMPPSRARQKATSSGARPSSMQILEKGR